MVSHVLELSHVLERLSANPRGPGFLFVVLERAEYAVADDEPWWTGFLPRIRDSSVLGPV